MRRHKAPGIDILEGDIFDLTPAMVGPIDAIHDRAALFALPPDIRRRYVAHLVALTGGAAQVLTCLDYGGAPDQGPPFSVTVDEVEALYAPHYSTSLLEEVVTALPSGDRDVDSLWLMARR